MSFEGEGFGKTSRISQQQGWRTVNNMAIVVVRATWPGRISIRSDFITIYHIDSNMFQRKSPSLEQVTDFEQQLVKSHEAERENDKASQRSKRI